MINLAEFAIRQRKFVLFFIVLSVIAGIYSYFDLGKLEDPSFTVKTAVVVTLYPGASAEEVEHQVTDTVETKLQEMAELDRLRSLSRPGLSMVFVDLKESLNSKALPQEWDLLRRKVDDVKLQLPSSAQISVVQDEFSEVYGMLFSIHSTDAAPEELRRYAEELQRQIKAVDGIKKIELHGVQPRVVHIDMPDERLAQYGLSIAQVWNQLSTQNSTFEAGKFDAGTERIRIAQTSEFQSLEDIRNLIINGGTGEFGSGLIRLGDIADITMGYQTPALAENRYNGEPAVTLAVSPVQGINVVSLGDTIQDIIANYQATLPLGVDISTVAYQPEEVQKSIDDFVGNLLESVAIVFVVLLVFMGFKSATIVGASLLLTILLTLVYMNIASIDLHRVSLGTFILALGMLVDNAIVITDMMIAKLNKGIERTRAAIDSVKETAVPLLGATVIAIMGASPVLFSKTDSAEFASSVFYIVASSLLLSWIVAMTFTVLMAWMFIKPKANNEETKPSRYKQLVFWTVDNPRKALAALVPLILVTAVAIPYVAVNFIPQSDRSIVFLDYWLPNGAKIEQTSADMRKVEEWLVAQPEVESISSYVGTSAPRFSVTVEPEPLDPAYGQILINTKDYESISHLVTRGDDWLKEAFPDAEPRFRALKLATKDKFAVEVRFSGPDETVLHQLAAEAKTIFASNPDAKYIRDDWRQESKVLKPILNQDKMRQAGINRADVAFALKRASDGMPLGQMNLNDELIPIQLRGTSQNMASLETLPVRSLLGFNSVPLGQVVDGFELVTEESMIWRRDRVKTITVQAGVSRDSTPANVRNAIKDQVEAIQLPTGYSMEWGGEYYDEDKAVTDIMKQQPKAMLIMVIILVAMFNGFKQPIIILATLPLAASGAVFALLGFDKPFGFMALIGAITLTGMIIKNGIVLMDQIELERTNGKSLSDAIKEATVNRTMAISMGALTTALGMIPLLSDLLFDQMAATIIGGLAAATILSLFVMPALYRLAYKEKAPSTQTNAELEEASS
ncbi:TPA: efflux RND transporter permease subunit [Vibrio parahaemolyticus]|uniref:efflux RND transporter permease subunit n=1 Tax=Vibrio parahaemolyticus TaxID=670 RepID=UPI00193E0B5B|nr:efflux RND transporter permease subunit [Vibrio parahaemolyticus]EKB1965693.1 efflux RND transporter permease subunit [Vibrio parahaemolyticus]ELA8092304.1 efflux RND transporter permease subunit [Vibrio parahaemolyticus]MBM4797447.1 efflux RND transporter permease subunit [Vibrio parahaemolyticus]MBM4962534.1 efflux RND transporter permease subunit [Vibrio parahaemolyticus]MCG7790611.1 efflux RND transporter permease subunit [Vibrio parahaemolyticus]